MIVADTNLIAALLLSTPVTPAAEGVLEKDREWTAPGIWRYEFRNLLATQVRVVGLPVDNAIELCGKAEELIFAPGIEIAASAILHLAQQKKLSAYDAEFVALAMALNVKLVTVDGGILKAVPGLAIAPDVFIAG